MHHLFDSPGPRLPCDGPKSAARGLPGVRPAPPNEEAAERSSSAVLCSSTWLPCSKALALAVSCAAPALSCAVLWFDPDGRVGVNGYARMLVGMAVEGARESAPKRVRK